MALFWKILGSAWVCGNHRRMRVAPSHLPQHQLLLRLADEATTRQTGTVERALTCEIVKECKSFARFNRGPGLIKSSWLCYS